MSKKDYELIAKVLKDDKPTNTLGINDTWYNGTKDEWSTIVLNMARALASTNPRFNRARFLKACGYND